MQVFVNGFATGCAYGLIAIGFSVIFATCRFLHIAHAAVYAAGAYIAYLLSTQVGLTMPVSIALGIVGSAAIGGAMELAVYRPLRRRNASSLVMLVASLGLFVVLQNLISLLFGDDTKVLRLGPAHEGFMILGARLSPGQGLIFASSILVFGMAWPLLHLTPLGRIYRAVSNDSELARIYGIRVDLTVLVTFLVGSALAGFAGILVGYDLDLTPRMGFNALLMGVVAAIIGGIGSVSGAISGGLLIGIAQHFAASLLPTQWQLAIVFTILLLFLLLRPQGLLGFPIRRHDV